MLRAYGEATLASNPGSTVGIKPSAIKNENAGIFESIFITFGAIVKGLLNGYRKIISQVDCHLKTPFGGVLLSVVSRDPNNQMYPIAWAVVLIENKDTWSWFIHNLI